MTTARSVTLRRDACSMAPTTAGNAVFVDGVPVTGSTGTMPIGSGRLHGPCRSCATSIAVTYQSQLDEIARGLIEAFAESDQSATPDAAGCARPLHLCRRAGHAGRRHV